MKSRTTRNQDFEQARQAKKDEFYTSLIDIELELQYYKKHFKGKVVYCNCDDPETSNFFRFFSENFRTLGLKRLISTGYRSKSSRSFSRDGSVEALFIEKYGGKKHSVQLDGDGDFRSAESIALLQQADIVVTNPPFSLFREYVSQLVEYSKKFLIIGNMNAVTYNEIFPLFQANRMWYGPSIRSGDREFRVPEDYPLTTAGSRIDELGNKYIRVKGVRWFTNLEHSGQHETLDLKKSFCPKAYPKYANYDAIEVGKTMDIPFDYDGLAGVPITFLDKYNPRQFEILGSSKNLSQPMSKIAAKGSYQPGGPRFYLPNGDGTFRRMYDRIVIRKKQS